MRLVVRRRRLNDPHAALLDSVHINEHQLALLARFRRVRSLCRNGSMALHLTEQARKLAECEQPLRAIVGEHLTVDDRVKCRRAAYDTAKRNELQEVNMH